MSDTVLTVDTPKVHPSTQQRLGNLVYRMCQLAGINPRTSESGFATDASVFGIAKLDAPSVASHVLTKHQIKKILVNSVKQFYDRMTVVLPQVGLHMGATNGVTISSQTPYEAAEGMEKMLYKTVIAMASTHRIERMLARSAEKNPDLKAEMKKVCGELSKKFNLPISAHNVENGGTDNNFTKKLVRMIPARDNRHRAVRIIGVNSKLAGMIVREQYKPNV